MRVAIVLMVFVIQIHSTAPERRESAGQKAGAGPNTGTDANSTHQPASTTMPSSRPQQGHDEALAYNSTEKNGKNKWDEITVFANIALVIVGIGGIVVAVCTLFKLERQTKATEDAAEAALKQAEHIIVTERPFIMIEASRRGDYLEFKANNYGRSPAKIIFNGHIEAIYPPLGEEPPVPPRYGKWYDDDRMEEFNVGWLAPHEDTVLGSYDLSAIREGAPEIFEEITTGQRRLFLYSVVKYRGILEDKIYRSKYCYSPLTNNGVRMSGLPGYNEYE